MHREDYWGRTTNIILTRVMLLFREGRDNLNGEFGVNLLKELLLSPGSSIKATVLDSLGDMLLMDVFRAR